MTKVKDIGGVKFNGSNKDLVEGLEKLEVLVQTPEDKRFDLAKKLRDMGFQSPVISRALAN